jgi:hypothetical protein
MKPLLYPLAAWLFLAALSARASVDLRLYAVQTQPGTPHLSVP